MFDAPLDLLSARQICRLLGRSETFAAARIESGELTPDALVELGSGRAPLPAFRRDRLPEIEALAAGRPPSVPTPPARRLAA